MSWAPIVLFTYNRPEHTRRTIEALRANFGADETDLHIYSDGPKRTEHASGVQGVRSYLPTVTGFRSVRIVERDRNCGLANSIIAGVTETLEEYSSVIVVEDDIITSEDFLSFMNALLKTYEPRSDVFSVTGYNYPLPIPASYPLEVYLSYRGSSWGWGTWRDRWEKVDWDVTDFQEFLNDPDDQARFARGGDDLPVMLKSQMEGKIDSWAIRFDYAHHRNDSFCVHAIRSRIRNIGFDGSGIHCSVSDDFGTEIFTGNGAVILPPDLQPDPKILKIFDARFRPASRAPKALASMYSVLSLIKKSARRVLRP